MTQSPAALRALLDDIVAAAGAAPTAHEALRAALGRACDGLSWIAGRLQFTAAAGELALRTFWHLRDAEDLSAFRAVAEEQQDGVESLLASLLEGRPSWTPIGRDGRATCSARAICAVPIPVGDRVFAVMELFSSAPDAPHSGVLDLLAEAATRLGEIVRKKPALAADPPEREYRTLFESAHDAILVVAPDDGAVLDANQRCADTYGYRRGELKGRPLQLLWPDADLQRLREAAAGQSGSFEAQHRRSDGSLIAVDVAAGPVDFGGQRAVWMSCRDVTERRRTLEQLRASEERYRLLFDASPQPMWVFDSESLRFLAVNQAAIASYGYTRDQFLSMTIAELRPEEERAMLLEHLGRLKDAASRSTVWRHCKANGAVINVEISSHPLEFAGRRARLVVANDVTERLRAEQKLWHAAFYDALTGLPNRSLFMERLGQAVERAQGRTGGGFAVLFLDLDRFKVVNDSMGHRAGDRLLVAIAKRLDNIRRAGDTVARLGGDEFAILVEDVEDAESGGLVAERVHRELAHPFEVEGQEVFTSASIGIALGGAGGHKPEDLLRDADTAMYRAKAQGAARHAVFDVTMHDHAVAMLQLENDLRRAIDRGELRVRYQPIVQGATGEIVGFEALVRWHHRQRGLVPPGEFIPMAEETGVIAPVGRWVLAEACRQMRAFHELHPRSPPLTLSVNLSGRQILQPDLVQEIADIVQGARLDPRLLRLEITESVLVDNEAAAARCLTGLRELGLQLVIDDFGTGYSSLSYLHRMPIDVLKIDAQFVQSMGVERNRRIVETILALGKNLGMDVIAEGVETREQAQALLRLGCGLMQGHLFSEAVEADEAARLLAAAPLRQSA